MSKNLGGQERSIVHEGHTLVLSWTHANAYGPHIKVQSKEYPRLNPQYVGVRGRKFSSSHWDNEMKHHVTSLYEGWHSAVRAAFDMMAVRIDEASQDEAVRADLAQFRHDGISDLDVYFMELPVDRS